MSWSRKPRLGVADAEETASTFVENAILKARHAARASGLPALGDDSGICVDALGGAPGLRSARYAGEHTATRRRTSPSCSTRCATCPIRNAPRIFIAGIVVLRHADDPAPLVAEGRWYGTILHAPRGDRGFGYDPVFFDPAFGKSAAELDATTKNRVSHRGQALAKLRELLRA